MATASLELGIDIGSVDLVCQLGPTHSLATFLQRVGRAEHRRGGLPKGRLFPLSRDELVEVIAMLRGVRNGELDTLRDAAKAAGRARPADGRLRRLRGLGRAGRSSSSCARPIPIAS